MTDDPRALADDDLLDLLTTAIDDSMDVDWISEWASRSILEAFKREGLIVTRPTPPGDYAELCERVRASLRRLAATKMEISLQEWGNVSTPIIEALAAIADLQRQLAEHKQPMPFYDAAEVIDGLENIALEAFWELNAFDDEDGGYRSLEAIAQSMGRDSEEVRQALDALVALDLADHSDDLKTPEGEDFGEGWARYENGDRLLNIYETLRYAERQFFKRHQLAERDAVQETPSARITDDKDWEFPGRGRPPQPYAVQGDLVELVAKIIDPDGWNREVARKTATAVIAAIGPAIRAEERAKIVALEAEIERQSELAKTYRRAQLTAEEKLCRSEQNAQGWKRRATFLAQQIEAGAHDDD